MEVTPNLAFLREKRHQAESALDGQMFVVRRPFIVEGRRYKADEKVKLANLPVAKIAQLIELRYLQLAAAATSYVAARNFKMAPHDYSIGDVFSTKGVGPEKITQLLEHRYIQPAIRPTTA